MTSSGYDCILVKFWTKDLSRLLVHPVKKGGYWQIAVLCWEMCDSWSATGTNQDKSIGEEYLSHMVIKCSIKKNCGVKLVKPGLGNYIDSWTVRKINCSRQSVVEDFRRLCSLVVQHWILRYLLSDEQSVMLGRQAWRVIHEIHYVIGIWLCSGKVPEKKMYLDYTCIQQKRGLLTGYQFLYK